MLVVYQYPKCSTCRRALKWLDENNVAYTAKSIVEETPDADTLQGLIEGSKLPLRRFFNTSGQVYREGGYSGKVANMTAREAAEALASNGMLIKRPFVIGDKQLLVGFKEDAWAAKLLP